MECLSCNIYKSQIVSKDREIQNLNNLLTNQRLKSKAKLTQLQQAFQSNLSDHHVNGDLVARIIGLENHLYHVEEENALLKSDLSARQMDLDHLTLLLEQIDEQIKTQKFELLECDETSSQVDVGNCPDFERLHAQIVYKDNKIMELNSVILDKERQILDLQEMCREQDQVAQAKTKAFQIMQHKFMEASSRTTKECSTETDEKVFTEYNNNALNGCLTASSSRLIRSVNKTFLPGHAVMQIKTGDRHSPPPVDPSEDHSSFTTEKEIKDIDVGSKNSERNKNRKRVTFDLPPQQNEENGNKDDVAQTIIDLTSENDELRRIIQEMEMNGEHSAKDRIEKLEAELEQLRHDGKNLVFKARAASQTRIRELEEKIASMETKYNIEVETMKSKEETLRNAREWLLEENGKLMEQLSSLRQKIDDLREELNESLSEREKIRLKLENDRELIVKLADDLEDTRATATVLLEQKISILDDVERLKEALEALEEYIEVLETDIFIYEQHVGILRDSLGVSQIDRRTLIKSKAFETKLKALELEKDQMVKINNDEKLRIKALTFKIRSLENDNALLVANLDEIKSKLVENNDNKNTKSDSAVSLNSTLSAKIINEHEIFEQNELKIENLRKIINEKECEIDRLKTISIRKEYEEKKNKEKYDNELLNMEKKISILREMNEQILEHWRETDELLDEKDKEINKLREENEKFKKDSNSTDQDEIIDLVRMGQEMDSLREECERLRRDLCRVECMNFELQNELDKLEKARMQENDLTQSNDMMLDTIINNLENQRGSSSDLLNQNHMEISVVGEGKYHNHKFISIDNGQESARKILDCDGTDENAPLEFRNMFLSNTESCAFSQTHISSVLTDANCQTTVSTSETASQCENVKENLLNECCHVFLQKQLSSALVDDSCQISAILNSDLASQSEASCQPKVPTSEIASYFEASCQTIVLSNEAASQCGDIEEILADVYDVFSHKQISPILIDGICQTIVSANDVASQCEDIMENLVTVHSDLQSVGLNESGLVHSDQNDSNECSASPSQFDKVSSISVVPSKIFQNENLCNIGKDQILEQNLSLCECVTETTKVQDSLPENINQLMTLNAELETAVNVLNGEIWSLKQQLKAILNEREHLVDKLEEIVELREKDRLEAQQRESEFEQQKDMTETYRRQALLNENEYSRKLVEWQEKEKEMEKHRAELEQAYQQLTHYYQELQGAYNALYSQFYAQKSDSCTISDLTADMIDTMQTQYSENLSVISQLKEKLDFANNQIIDLRLDYSKQLSYLRLKIMALRDNELKLIKDLVVEHTALVQSDFLHQESEFEQKLMEFINQIVVEYTEYINENKQILGKIFDRDSNPPSLKNMTLLQLSELVRNLFKCEADFKDSSSVLQQNLPISSSSAISLCSSSVNYTGAVKAIFCPSKTQLDILATRLTSKTADNDALFRCNAELAHTNVRLQNEIDSLNAQIIKFQEKNYTDISVGLCIDEDVSCCKSTQTQQSYEEICVSELHSVCDHHMLKEGEKLFNGSERLEIQSNFGLSESKRIDKSVDLQKVEVISDEADENVWEWNNFEEEALSQAEVHFEARNGKEHTKQYSPEEYGDSLIIPQICKCAGNYNDLCNRHATLEGKMSENIDNKFKNDENLSKIIEEKQRITEKSLEYEEKLENQNKTIHILEEKNIALSNELEQSYHSLETNLADKYSLIQELEDNKLLVERLISQILPESNDAGEETKNKIERLCKEINSIRAQNDLLKDAETKLMDLVEERNIAVENLQNDIVIMASKIDEMIIAKNNLNVEKEELGNKLASVEKFYKNELKELRTKLEEYENITEKNGQQNQLASVETFYKNELEELRAKLEDYENLITEKSGLQNQLTSVETFYKNELEELRTKLEDYENLIIEKNGLQNQLTSVETFYKNELEELRTKLEDYDNLITEKNGLQNQLTSVETFYKNELEELRTKFEDYENLITEKNGLQNQLASAETFYKNELEELRTKLEDYENLITEKNGLQNQLTSVETFYKNELEELRTKLEEYENLITEKNGLQNQLTSVETFYKNELEELHTKLEEYERRYFIEEHKWNNEILAAKREIEIVKKNLQTLEEENRDLKQQLDITEEKCRKQDFVEDMHKNKMEILYSKLKTYENFTGIQEEKAIQTDQEEARRKIPTCVQIFSMDQKTLDKTHLNGAEVKDDQKLCRSSSSTTGFSSEGMLANINDRIQQLQEINGTYVRELDHFDKLFDNFIENGNGITTNMAKLREITDILSVDILSINSSENEEEMIYDGWNILCNLFQRCLNVCNMQIDQFKGQLQNLEETRFSINECVHCLENTLTNSLITTELDGSVDMNEKKIAKIDNALNIEAIKCLIGYDSTKINLFQKFFNMENKKFKEILEIIESVKSSEIFQTKIFSLVEENEKLKDELKKLKEEKLQEIIKCEKLERMRSDLMKAVDDYENLVEMLKEFKNKTKQEIFAELEEIRGSNSQIWNELDSLKKILFTIKNNDENQYNKFEEPMETMKNMRKKISILENDLIEKDFLIKKLNSTKQKVNKSSQTLLIENNQLCASEFITDNINGSVNVDDNCNKTGQKLTENNEELRRVENNIGNPRKLDIDTQLKNERRFSIEEEDDSVENADGGKEEVIPDSLSGMQLNQVPEDSRITDLISYEIKPCAKCLKNNAIMSKLKHENMRIAKELCNVRRLLVTRENDLQIRIERELLLESNLKDFQLQCDSLSVELTRNRSIYSHKQNSQNQRVAKLQEKISETEQFHNEELEQFIDELHIAEAKLRSAENIKKENEKMMEQLQNKIREWATRCSDLIRENEALLRANEGVKTLESIISKINEEKQHLYHELCDIHAERTQLLSIRDHLCVCLDEANTQIQQLREKLHLSINDRTAKAMKIIELQAEIHAIKVKLSKVGSVVDQSFYENDYGLIDENKRKFFAKNRALSEGSLSEKSKMVIFHKNMATDDNSKTKNVRESSQTSIIPSFNKQFASLRFFRAHEKSDSLIAINNSGNKLISRSSVNIAHISSSSALSLSSYQLSDLFFYISRSFFRRRALSPFIKYFLIIYFISLMSMFMRFFFILSGLLTV